MTEENPYQAPSYEARPVDAPQRGDSTNITITQNMIDSLLLTKPWVLLLSILGFIGAGFMVLGTAIIGIALAVEGGGDETVPLLIILLVYPLCAVLYLFLSLFLFKYARNIQSFSYSRQTGHLEDALFAQMKFWKTMGIVAISAIGLSIVGTIGAVIAAAAGF